MTNTLSYHGPKSFITPAAAEHQPDDRERHQGRAGDLHQQHLRPQNLLRREDRLLQRLQAGPHLRRGGLEERGPRTRGQPGANAIKHYHSKLLQ